MISAYRFCVLLPLMWLLGPFAAKSQPVPDPASSTARLNAHTGRGMAYVGGDFGMGLGLKASSLSYLDATAIADAQANGRLGFYPLRKLLLGGAYSFNGSVASFDTQRSYRLYIHSFSLFARTYLHRGLFIEGSYGKSVGKEHLNAQASLVRQHFEGLQKGFALGLSHFWMNGLSFELLLRYENISPAQNNRNLPAYMSGLGVSAGLAYSLALY